MTGWRRWISKLLRVRVFIPLVLAASLLAFAFSIGHLPSAFGYVRHLTVGRLAICLGLAFAYLTLKGIQFNWLLHGLGAKVPWRQFVLAYAIGEMTIPLPAGVYVQNYVLQRVSGELFGLTSAATAAMLALEVIVILFALIFLPMPSRHWVSAAAMGLLAGTAFVALTVAVMRHWRHSIMRFLRGGKLRNPGQALADMLEGFSMLMQPWLIARVTLLTVLYLFPLIVAFYLVGDGIGLDQFNLVKAASVYLSAMIVVLLGIGLLSQLGTIEVVGIGVALAWGYGLTQALALMMGFRLVWVVSIWILTGAAAVLLSGEFKHSSANRRQKAEHRLPRR